MGRCAYVCLCVAGLCKGNIFGSCNYCDRWLTLLESSYINNPLNSAASEYHLPGVFQSIPTRVLPATLAGSLSLHLPLSVCFPHSQTFPSVSCTAAHDLRASRYPVRATIEPRL